jgi:hypothetical protein
MSSSCCPLSAKPWAVALVAIIVILSLTAYAYTSSNAALDKTVHKGLETTAGVMATQINASEIEGLQPGDEGTPRYMAVVARLKNLRGMDDHILNAYILKVNPDQTAVFLVDDLYPDDPAGSAKIGELSTDPNRDRIFAALSAPTSSKGPYTTKYGSFMSAYAPIDDAAHGSSGNTAAVLAIDISAKSYTDAVSSSGYAIILAGVISSLLVLVLAFKFGSGCRKEN